MKTPPKSMRRAAGAVVGSTGLLLTGALTSTPVIAICCALVALTLIGVATFLLFSRRREPFDRAERIVKHLVPRRRN